MLGHHNGKTVLYDKLTPFPLIFIGTSISKPQIKQVSEIVIKKQDPVLLTFTAVQIWWNSGAIIPI